MENNVTMIALVAIVAIVIVAALVIMQQQAAQTTPGPSAQDSSESPPLSEDSGAITTPTEGAGEVDTEVLTELPQLPDTTDNGTEGNSPISNGTNIEGGEVETGSEGSENEIETENEEDMGNEEQEPTPAALECDLDIQGQKGSLSADSKIEGTNAAGQGTMTIPGYSAQVKFIIQGSTAYVNFPKILNQENYWYRIPVSELSEILLSTDYTEGLSPQEIKEIDPVQMMLELAEVEVSTDDLSDMEAIIRYVGAQEGMSQTEIDNVVALIPQSLGLSCKYVDDIADSVFELPSNVVVKDGLPIWITMML